MTAKDTKPLRIVVPGRVFGYLTYLAKNTVLGANENDVAGYLLTQRLEVMLAEKYHEKIKQPE